jgi:hypothetical protein
VAALAATAAVAAGPPAGGAEVTLLGGGGTLRAGHRAALDLAVRDPATRWPLDGLAVRAWLRAPLPPGETCAEATRQLARFGAAPRHALSLDGLRLLAPGDDGTLGVVDPRLSLATANLVRVDRLTGDRPPSATVLDAAESVLWATLPDEDVVLRHDLATGEPTRHVTLPGDRPTDLAGPLPDVGEGAVAVGLDGAGAVARLDRDGRETARRGVGRGPVHLALGAGRLVALAAGEGRLTVLDPWTLEVRSALSFGGPAEALALVDRQDLALVAAGDRLRVISVGRSGARPAMLADVGLGVAPDRLASSPDGRWMFALDRARSVVAIVDLARGPRLAHALAFEEGAEELAVGLDLLYVRLRDAPAMAILPFAALEAPVQDRTPTVERVTMGAAPTGAAGRSLMAPGPGGRGLWLAHPTDRRAYLFTGGAMRAPETAVPLKGSAPAGLLLQPLAPQPRGGGVYRATLGAPASAGRYLLAVALDRPAEAHCLEIAVEGGDDRGNQAVVPGPVTPPRLEASLAGGVEGAIAGRETVVVLRAVGAVDPGAISGRALAVRAFPLGGGNWQQRAVARPDPGGAEPGWSTRLRFPAPGRYVVLAEAPGAGLRYEDAPRLVVEVRADAGEGP